MREPVNLGLYGGMHIMCVEPGSVVTDERSGERVTIDDNTYAIKGSVAWVTENVYARIKAAALSTEAE